MKSSFDRTFYGVALALVCLTLVVYWPALQADFINYDDQDYVVNNAQVKAGLTWEGVKWAFTTDLMGSWHPVTWLSHMLDVELFGMEPGKHHATNLVLHIANSILLLVLFRLLTGAFWASAAAALLFALHPLHVESVAWVAERKDVLAAFFGLLALIAYGCYAHERASRPAAEQSGWRPILSSRWYWLCLLWLALGLLSKPMLVTWPFVMLLLDWWPLRRIGGVFDLIRFRQSGWLWLEKLPFLMLVVAIAAVTLVTQNNSEAVMSLDQFPLANRLANVLHSLFVYLWQFVWPVDLAPFYPFETQLGTTRLLLAGVVVVGVTVWALLARRSQTYLTFGWLWYLIVLFPVCGLVQAGLQAHADRYMYLPSIGVGVMLIWAVAKWINGSPQKQKIAVLAGCAVAFILGDLTHQQAERWQNSERLFRHTLAVTERNFMAHQGLGEELLKKGLLAEAKEQFEIALGIYPNLPSAENNLAALLMNEGRETETISRLQKLLEKQPAFHTARFNLAEAYERLGQYEEALASYRAFATALPDDLEARLRIIRCLERLNRESELNEELNQVLRIQWSTPQQWASLAIQIQLIGKTLEAIKAYSQGIESFPESAELQNNLAWLLATHSDASVRDGDRAIELGERAVLLDPQQAIFIGTLAAAYAEAGRFDDAVAAAQRAIELATVAGQTQVAARNAELLELYRAGKPYHESPR